MWRKVVSLLTSIKLSHTLFSLPFAATAALLIAGETPELSLLAKIFVALFFARTSGMLFNRLVDRKLDSENPRTKKRELASGNISPALGWTVFGLSTILFLMTCLMINSLVLKLSPLALFIICFYSYTKRFTFFCHFFVGLVLGVTPLAVFVALKGTVYPPLEIWFLSLAVFFWVTGFDIIYATLDTDFDIKHKLHSLPVYLGNRTALRFSALLHFLTLLFLLLTGFQSPLLGNIYYGGMALVTILFVVVHSQAAKSSPESINQAFFQVNIWVGIVTFLVTALEVLHG